MVYLLRKATNVWRLNTGEVIAFDEVRPSEEHDGYIHITMWIQRQMNAISLIGHLQDFRDLLHKAVSEKWPPDLSTSDDGSDDSEGGAS